jgi:molecular chaperone GrpE
MSEEVDYKDKYLRALAELENLRKRHEIELRQAREQGRREAFRDVTLPIVDDVERTFQAFMDPTSTTNLEAMREGTQAVTQKARRTLSLQSIEAFETVGKPFKASHMEAIAKAPAKGLPPGGVVYEAERGYMIDGQLLRPAKVVVAEEE